MMNEFLRFNDFSNETNAEIEFPKYVKKYEKKYVKKNPLYADYFDTTYKTDKSCSYIVKPRTHEDLVAKIKQLNEEGLSFYVVSSGKNIGYGGKAPEEDVDVLLDLGSLKKIDVDAEKATVVLGAGVTQQELFDYLVASDLELSFHITGAPADTSILGNAMAGGYANGVNSVRYDKVISVRGVHNDGSEINTHSSSNTRYTDLPDLRGYFKGGQNGVLSEIKLELDQIPEYTQISFFSVDPGEDIAGVMDTCEFLKKNNVVNSNISIFNSYRIYAENTGHCCDGILYNQKEFKSNIYSFMKENNLEFWSGEYNGVMANGYTNYKVCEVTEQYIEGELKKHLSKYKSVTVTKEDVLRLRKDINAELPKGAIEGMRGRILTFSGIPSFGSVSMGYWRKKSKVIEDMDLERDKTGFIWLALSLDPDSKNTESIITNLEDIVISHNLEPFYVVDYIRTHESYIMWSIIYDRDNIYSDNIAMECYNECVDYINSNENVNVYRGLRGT